MTPEIQSALTLQEAHSSTNGSTIDVAELLPHWQEALESLSDSDYLGITELLAAYNDRLENAVSDAALQRLGEWAALLQTFLSSASPESMQALLAFLNAPVWETPIADEQLELLAELLEADRLMLSTELSSVPEAFESADLDIVDGDAFCSVDTALLESASIEIDADLLPMFSEQLRELLVEWKNPQLSPDVLIASVREKIALLGRAAEAIELWGIKQLLIGFERNLALFEEDPELVAPDSELAGLIADVLASLHAYFVDFANATHYRALLQSFANPEWPYCLGEEDTQFLDALLQKVFIRTANALVAEQARPDDVSLAVQTDTDAELLDMLLHELPLLADEFSRQLQRVINAGDLSALIPAQRAAHTLKGLANTAGIKGVANLTHRLEDILEMLGNANLLPGKALAECLSEAGDCLETMAEATARLQPAPENALAALQRVMDWHYRLRAEGVTVAGQPPQENAVTNRLISQHDDEESDARPNVETAQEETYIRVSKTTLDQLLRIAGETRTLNAQLREAAGHIKTAVKAGRERHRAMQKLIAALEHRLNMQFIPDGVVSASHAGFDPLEMNCYSEMHEALARLHELTNDNREVDLHIDAQIRKINDLLVTQTDFYKENLQHVLHSRLTPAKSLEARLQRIVRQACRSTGKSAELSIDGGDTMIDSQILTVLAEPLLHMLRNAVDHGLEMPEVRLVQGKESSGRLTLSFARHGDTIRIDCRDDGRGLDHEAIRATAERKGLIDPQTALTPQESQRLILLPGFSTRETSTQLSGRGIGMDVVHQQILKLKGTLDIESEPGQGCCLHLTLPADTLTVRALLIQSGGRLLALSSYPIERCVLSTDGILQETPHGLTFSYAGHPYPAIAVETLLRLPPYDYSAVRLFPVLLVNSGAGEKTALLVPKITGHQEVVFKTLGNYVANLPGISGVTILATGQVAPVVDVPGLIAQQALRGKIPADFTLQELPQALPKLLVVDDSLSARKSLAMLLKDSGYDVSTAIDGVDAMNQVRREAPDLILTDLEMPRMTGLELSSALRSSADNKHIPIIMITSRSTEKHRQEAQAAGVDAYLTKPWTEQHLLDQVDSLLQRSLVH